MQNPKETTGSFSFTDWDIETAGAAEEQRRQEDPFETCARYVEAVSRID